MKFYFIGLLIILFPFLCTYGSNVKGEEQITLNKFWKFKVDPNNNGIQEKWYEINYPDVYWEDIAVPGNWDLSNQHANYKGKSWYRTRFSVGDLMENKNYSLKFGEVGMSYTVYLNGKLIAKVLAGNYEEEFDISTALNKTGDNILAVEVDNTLSWGAYWNWGGIRRPVKLLIREPIFIQRQEVSSYPVLKTNRAVVITAVYLKNTSSKSQEINLLQQVSFLKKPIASYMQKKILIPANAEKKVVFKIDLDAKQVKLWHFDYPQLYVSKITLSESSKSIHTVNNHFGIRKIEIINQQLHLNGERVRLVGYNWVADDRATGSVLPEYRYKEDIDLMKSAGANMARLSHRPLPQDVMDYLDEKGILIFSEFNNWPPYMNAESTEPKEFAHKLITQNYNHPCIIGWSVGNENGDLKEYPQVNEYTKNIITYIKKELDSTRLVAYVSHTADYQPDDAAQYGDLIMINKYGNYDKAVKSLQVKYPNKAVFMSEYGGHSSNLIYDTPNNSTFSSLMVDSLADNKNLIGYSLWTFNDYRSNYQSSNPVTSTPLYQNRQWGIVDVYRNKKRAYPQMQKFYAPIKNIQVSINKTNDKENTSDIVIISRSFNDIPAYTLRGYFLTWEVKNSENNNSQLGFICLKDIAPGSPAVKHQFKWSAVSAGYLKISLLSPTGYLVKDTVLYLTAPPVPVIKHLIEASNTARVIFDRNDFATQYKVYYKTNGKIDSMSPTIDHYVDLNNLNINKQYTIWLTALNNKGESSPSEAVDFIPKAGYIGLPPVIWQSQPAYKSFNVGYSYHFSDSKYLIRYGTSLTNKDLWKVLGTTNMGMLHVPDLDNNQKYFYQISKNTGFSASDNQWSEMKNVTPTEGSWEQPVKLYGYKQQNNKLLISVEQIKGAVNYTITCKTNNKPSYYYVNQSAVQQIIIDINPKDNISDVSVKATIKYD
jgi:beta-galactosidase